MYIFIIPAAVLVVAFICSGFRIMRPTHRGVVETFGLYSRFIRPGLHWIIPGVQKIHAVRVTEQTMNLDPQLVTTNDNLGVIADAHIYLRIKPDEICVKASLYDADSAIEQTVNMARTTLRDVFATIPLRRVSIDREQIGAQVCRALGPVAEGWGVEVLRCEMKEIELPKDVQEIMHKLARAEHEKLAAADFAAAAEINADGIKRAEIKKAEGAKQARILAAEAKAKAIRVISEAAKQYFSGKAQLLKILDTAESALKNNTKVVLQDTGKLFDLLGRFGAPVEIAESDDKQDHAPEQDE